MAKPLRKDQEALFEMAPGVPSIDSHVVQTIHRFDRSSDPLPSNEAHRDECRQLMTGYMHHVASRPAMFPPDEKILGVMLRVAEWETLGPWLKSMLSHHAIRPPQDMTSPYAWLVAVAIEKLHGIAPEEQKPTLALLRGGKQLRSKWADLRDQATHESAKRERERHAEDLRDLDAAEADAIARGDEEEAARIRTWRGGA